MRYGVRIEAPHFVARLEVDSGRVVEAAPILRYMVGWTTKRVRGYVDAKGWRADLIGDPSDGVSMLGADRRSPPASSWVRATSAPRATRTPPGEQEGRRA